MLDKHKIKHSWVVAFCWHLIFFAEWRESEVVRVGKDAAGLSNVTAALWAQFGEPLASVSERVRYPSNAGYYSSFRRTRLPHPSARLVFPSTFPGKRRHVGAKTARYGGKVQKTAVFMPSLSLHSCFDAVNLVVDIYKWLLHTTMLSEEPQGTLLCPRLFFFGVSSDHFYCFFLYY